MSDVIGGIKRDFAQAVTKRCSEKGCTLKLDGLGNYVVLKGEKARSDHQDYKICDCIVFVLDDVIAIGIVELKGKSVRSTEIAEKLTHGSEIALEALRRCAGDRVNRKFYHLLLHRGLDPSEHRKIGKERITIGGKKHEIIIKRCGTSLSAVISGRRA